jgi:FkbH-like protein
MSCDINADAFNPGSPTWIELQTNLLTGGLSRLQISDLIQLKLKEEVRDLVHVRVWRNYAAEPMENTFLAIGSYWGIHYELDFMGYDDSLSFVDGLSANTSSHVEVILIDRAQYLLSDEEFYEWISNREQHLATTTGNTIVTAIADQQIVIRFDSTEVARLPAETDSEVLYDTRYEKLTGSRLTPRTHFLIARELSAAWVGSAVASPKKLIVVDLDFTLHEGVLGELQGNVNVTGDYLKLQEQLLIAKQRGFMLAIISKNDQADVLKLLSSQSAYLLRESDFVCIEASWESKHVAMSEILKRTRINQDAVIFIDDNPVELLQMNIAFPKISLVSAAEGPVSAVETLLYIPGYQRQRGDDLGETRILDIQSNDERAELIRNGLNSYYLSASPVITIAIRDELQLERLVDLARRSNQFNLTLSRAGLAEYQSNDAIWIGLSLKDRFSESGIIGGILLKKLNSDECSIHELFLSCRVLGRGLETALICQGILAGVMKMGTKKISISWSIGERNEPALNWLTKSILDSAPTTSGSVTLSNDQIKNLAAPPKGVQVEVTG